MKCESTRIRIHVSKNQKPRARTIVGRRIASRAIVVASRLRSATTVRVGLLRGIVLLGIVSPVAAVVIIVAVRLSVVSTAELAVRVLRQGTLMVVVAGGVVVGVTAAVVIRLLRRRRRSVGMILLLALVLFGALLLAIVVAAGRMLGTLLVAGTVIARVLGAFLVAGTFVSRVLGALLVAGVLGTSLVVLGAFLGRGIVRGRVVIWRRIVPRGRRRTRPLTASLCIVPLQGTMQRHFQQFHRVLLLLLCGCTGRSE